MSGKLSRRNFFKALGVFAGGFLLYNGIKAIAGSDFLEERRITDYLSGVKGMAADSPPIELGIFPDLDKYDIDTCLQQVSELERALSVRFAKISTFSSMYGWGNETHEYILERIISSGRMPEISLGLGESPETRARMASEECRTYFLYGADENGIFSSELFRERHESFFSGMARKLKTTGAPVFLRFGYEFNMPIGDYGFGINFSDGHSTLYKNAFRETVQIFRENNAYNVLFVMSPGLNWQEGKMLEYYAGHDYVDILGVDGYDLYFGTGEHPNDLHDKNPEEVFYTVLEELIEISESAGKKKPVIFSEFGTGRLNPGAAALWTESAIRYAISRGVVQANYFNYNKEYMHNTHNIFDVARHSIHNLFQDLFPSRRQADSKCPPSGKITNNTWERDWRLERDEILMSTIISGLAELSGNGYIQNNNFYTTCERWQDLADRDLGLDWGKIRVITDNISG